MDNNQEKREGNLSASTEGMSEGLFFSGAHRRKLLEEVKKGIFAGVTVTTITGDNGSGKTTICKMVEKELPEEYLCVYLPETLESFDDVLRILARRVGMTNLEAYGSSQDLVVEISDYLEGGRSRLVVVFDQAQLMYLATLERIRKMLDKINKPEVLFQIILAGRSSLLENLKRLSICNFSDIEERHFTLSSLGLSETYAYLNHFARQLSKVGGKNIFSPEAAKKVYTLAQGNFGQTNIMAEKALQSYDPTTSPMVFIDNVNEGDSEALAKSKKKKKAVSYFGSKKIVGGVLVFFIMVGSSFFFLREGKDNEPFVGRTQKGTEQVAAISGNGAGDSDKNAYTMTTVPSTNTKVENQKEEKIHSDIQKREPESSTDLKAMVEESSKKTVKSTSKETKESEPPLPVAVQEAEVIKENQTGIDVVDTTLAKLETTEEEKTMFDVVEIKDVDISSTTNEEQQVEPDTSTTPEETAPQIIEPEIVDKNQEEKAEEETVATEISSVPLQEETGAAESTLEQVEKTTISFRSEAVEVVEASTKVIEEVDVAEDNTARMESSVSTVSAITASNKSEEDQNFIPLEDEVITLSGNNKRIPLANNTEAEGKKLVKIAPAKVNIPQTSLTDTSSGEVETNTFSKIFQQRVMATDQWLSGEKNNRFTVQLMKLTSGQAEENLKQRLEQEEYREVADKLYIIKNLEASSVYVYYGEYADHDSARKVRNTLPIFLRKHNPYTISVENAVKKATSQ